MATFRIPTGAARQFGQSINSVAQQFAMAPIEAERLRMERTGQMADLAHRQAQIGKLRAETASERRGMQLRDEGLSALPGATAGLPEPQANTLAEYFSSGQFGRGVPHMDAQTPAWATPEVMDRYNRGRSLAAMTSASTTANPQQIANARGELRSQGDMDRIVAGTLDPQDAAEARFAVRGGSAPWVSGDYGQIFSAASGAERPPSSLTEAFAGRQGAEAARARAQAERYGSQADYDAARADKVRAETEELGEFVQAGGNLWRRVERPDGTVDIAPVASASDQPGGSYSSGDAGRIHSSVASLFGGLYDPITGEFSGLKKEFAEKAIAISARAEELFRSSGGQLGHLQAVQAAASEFGIDLPGAVPTGPPPGSGGSGAPDPGADPAGLRSWLLQ